MMMNESNELLGGSTQGHSTESSEKKRHDEKETFPDGKIVLLNGTQLDCYPLADEDVEPEFQDKLELDTTGQYLTVRNCKPRIMPVSDECMQKRQLFVDNAFYLLAHMDRIMNDSRMFLTPVAARNGLAYTGTSGFKRPTLGVYLEWWQTSDDAMRIDNEGCRSLVYSLAGSPLSGMNRCSTVREDGNIETVTLSSFGRHCGSFIKINTRYTEAKVRYQAYTLQEVLDILHREDNGKLDYDHVITTHFMQHEIDRLNRCLERLTEESSHWREKYLFALISFKEDEARAFLAEDGKLETKVSQEIEHLKMQKKALKAQLKRGQIDNVSYQRSITPMNKRIEELKFQLFRFRHDKLNEIFQTNVICSGTIERYFREKDKQSQHEN
jgi:hypothetical protein